MRMIDRSAVVLSLVGLGFVWGGRTANAEPPQRSAKNFEASQVAELHRLIRPQSGEARWEEVPWMPSNDIWAARRKAAAEGKPILLWYMAGEPLGTC